MIGTEIVLSGPYNDCKCFCLSFFLGLKGMQSAEQCIYLFYRLLLCMEQKAISSQKFLLLFFLI